MKAMNRGFTVVELLVSLAIFVAMTSVIVAKFGTFNQSTLLTDTAYDVALIVRLAQSYGLSVKSATQIGSGNFSYPYGVDFNIFSATSCGSASSNATTLVLFADYDGATDDMCDSNDVSIRPYLLVRGAYLSGLCVGADTTACYNGGSVTRINVSYQRPNPEAKICATKNGGSVVCNYAYAEATISGSDGSTRTIVMRQNGQISVKR
ncbi:MAG: prepilin-type N-terminal cleavage/methylation domain-containing protein [Candidatus Taylorbacteria bacterium]|nr:prepilin-type N-terminal cleavage/methylation domain-containing protein [Candidatus Taylorbacteria bacterium]